MLRLKERNLKKMPSNNNKKGGVKNGDIFNTPFFVIAGLGIIAVAISLWIALGSSEKFEDIVPEPIDVGTDYNGPRHPLSGTPVADDALPGILAVMVENSQDANPLSGVEDANVIIEAPVEGNITRWMVLFTADQDVDEIGPVRSARPYYVDYALAWDALYAHVGGSPEALDLIEERGLSNLNEFYNGGSFWRSRSRFAPHNAYTEISRLASAWDRILGDDYEPEYGVWKFKDVEPEEEDRPEGHEIDVEFNGYWYDVTWVYDPESNSYIRYQGGSKHKARSGDVLYADNVAIVLTDMEVIDDVGRQKITTVGEGDAVILIDGEVIEGTWTKDSRSDMLRFYDGDGDEVVFNVGKTWIQIVNEDKGVSIE